MSTDLLQEYRDALRSLFYHRGPLGLRVDDVIAEEDPALWRQCHALLNPEALAMREYVKRNNGGFTTPESHQPMIPESQNIPGLGGSPTGHTPAHTTPPLFQQLATLLRPLARAERQRIPGWYLAERRWRIAPAPPGSPLGERMRRRCVAVANVLWWPIARALTLWFFWRDGLDRQAAIACWRAIAVGRRNLGWDLVPKKSEAPSSAPVQSPGTSTPVKD